jgi:hypothetical protein
LLFQTSSYIVIKLLLKNSCQLTGSPDHADAFALYNLQGCPDELHGLFGKDITAASQMKNELLAAIDTANRNYQEK